MAKCKTISVKYKGDGNIVTINADDFDDAKHVRLRKHLSDDASSESTPYDNNTVAELKDILSDRGLTVSGNKAELIASLVADDAEAGD